LGIRFGFGFVFVVAVIVVRGGLYCNAVYPFLDWIANYSLFDQAEKEENVLHIVRIFEIPEWCYRIGKNFSIQGDYEDTPSCGVRTFPMLCTINLLLQMYLENIEIASS
jgi:hypothetical protein